MAPNQINEMLSKFIENFLNEKTNQYWESNNRRPHDLICDYVTRDDFEEKVIKDTSFEHCLIKIFKEHCPGCETASVLLQGLSHKLKDKGALKDFRVFLVDVHNEIP